MTQDLASFQAKAIARGYTHDFGGDARSKPRSVTKDLRIVDCVIFDSGTDPGDDATMYLIESAGGPSGYLVLADSFHSDPRKAAFLDALLGKHRVGG